MWWWQQLSKKCFHVSGSGEGHIEQVMDGYNSGPKNSCLRAIPMY
jgi:hypothetical protein